MKVSSDHVAWIAGFYEGEGSLCRRKDKYRNLRVQIMQVEREPLDRVAEWTGVGKVFGPYQQKNRPSTQPYFVYAIGALEETLEFLWLVFPWLSARRQDQIERVLYEDSF